MIRGSNRVISNRQPAASFGIHNRFDIEVIDAETGKLKQEAKAYNVICDKLWTRLFAKYTYFAYIHYGSGTGTPSATDTELFNYVGGQTATDETASIDYENGVFNLRKQIQLAAGTAVGVNITEVGIAYGSDSSYLCTHAMLQDMNGNRVSITKTDTDVINIYATVYVHFNPNGYDGGYVRPTTYIPTVSLFAFLCGHANTLANRMYLTPYDTASVSPGKGGGYPQDALYNYVDITTTCDATNKTITFAPKRIESSQYNIGGFRQLMFTRYSYGSQYDIYEPWFVIRPGGSWFPYSQITAEAVGTGDGSTVDYSLAFPFVHDMKVYIDGVETTDFTYDYAPNTDKVDIFNRYLQTISPDSTVGNHIDVISYNDITYYNPAYELGVASINTYLTTGVYTSDDLVTWVTLQQEPENQSSTTATSTITVPPEYVHNRYWRTKQYYQGFKLIPPTTLTGKNLHFNTPPAAGAVITADYKTDTIAKDANHVFDCSVTIQIGEYTGD